MLGTERYYEQLTYKRCQNGTRTRCHLQPAQIHNVREILDGTLRQLRRLLCWLRALLSLTSLVKLSFTPT